MRDLSMKQTRCYRAQSSGSRFLVAGLLPLRRLRCSWLSSGALNLSHVKRDGCISVQLGHSAGGRHKQVTLRRARGISHCVSEYVYSGTSDALSLTANCGSTFIARGAP
jgi:hypothetical protein